MGNEDYELIKLPGMGIFDDDSSADKKNESKSENMALGSQNLKADLINPKSQETRQWNYLNRHRDNAKTQRKTTLDYVIKRNEEVTSQIGENNNDSNQLPKYNPKLELIKAKLRGDLSSKDISASQNTNSNLMKASVPSFSYIKNENDSLSKNISFPLKLQSKPIMSQCKPILKDDNFEGDKSEAQGEVNHLESKTEVQSDYGYNNGYNGNNSKFGQEHRIESPKTQQNTNIGFNDDVNDRYIKAKMVDKLAENYSYPIFGDDFSNVDYKPSFPTNNNIMNRPSYGTNQVEHRYSPFRNDRVSQDVYITNVQTQYEPIRDEKESNYMQVSRYNSPIQNQGYGAFQGERRSFGFLERENYGIPSVQSFESQNDFSERELETYIRENGTQMLQVLNDIKDKAKNDVLRTLLDGEWHNEKDLIRIAKKSRYMGTVGFGIMMHSFKETVYDQFLLKKIEEEGNCYYKIHDNFVGLARAAYCSYKDNLI